MNANASKASSYTSKGWVNLPNERYLVLALFSLEVLTSN